MNTNVSTTIFNSRMMLKFALVIIFYNLAGNVQLFAQSYSNSGTGTDSDRYTINDDNSNHISHLRLQTGNNSAFNIFNEGTKLKFSWDGSNDHNSYLGDSTLMFFDFYDGQRLWVNGTVENKKLIVNPKAKNTLGEDIPGIVALINGGVHISHQDSTPKGYNAQYKDDYLLWVEKGIVAADYAVAEPEEWADYIFAEEYKLTPLEERENFIKEYKHLPGIPSEKEISRMKHYKIHDVILGQLKNIEELMLYTIEQEKRIKMQEVKLVRQNELIIDLEDRLRKLEDNN